MSDDPFAALAELGDDLSPQAMLDLMKEALTADGVDEATIRWAEERRALVLLALERFVVPGDRRFTRGELVGRVGMSLDEADRLWRSLGFATVTDDDRHFAEADQEALQAVKEILANGLTEPAMVYQMARVIGSSMARVAEAQISALNAIRSRQGTGAGPGEAGRVPELQPQGVMLLPRLEQFLIYAWRRHLQAAARRELHQEATEASGQLAVGFVDLVGFTTLAREVSEEALVDVVDTFVGLAFEAAGIHGARVVKTIGDEVMLVADEPGSLLDVALALVDACASDDTLPETHVGLSLGPVTAIEGDYYGPTVNLAHRVVAVARPGTVVTSDSFHDAVADGTHQWVRLRTRRLKGIGETRLWVVRQPG
jgi:adenylate cyclase